MNSKIYRCGWCGCPTNTNGGDLPENLFKRVVNIIEKYGDDHTEKTPGDCCAQEQQREANSEYVTRDMAIDAGDPSLEGQQL